MRDIELMFENAKTYNEDESEIYMDAVELQACILTLNLMSTNCHYRSKLEKLLRKS